jgi:SAM-dependent methyltransferase
LETSEYDLAHCSKLLHHLPEAEKALRRMTDALRPGGWLLVEEDDLGSTFSLGVTDPSAAPFMADMRTFFDSLRKKGIADYYFGRRVRGLVEQLGLLDVDQEGWTQMVRGGDPQARVSATGFQLARETLIAAGLTQELFDFIIRIGSDPSRSWPSLTLFCAWGRKPAGEGRTSIG